VRTALLFAAAQALPVLFGLPAAFHPRLRSFTWPARLAAAFLAGNVVLAAALTLLSAVGVAWAFGLVSVLLGLPALALAWAWGRRPAESFGLAPLGRPAAVGFSAAVGLGCAWALAAFGAAAATSGDLLYFWGVKGVRFALAQGIDFELLSLPFAVHTHVTYPPLWSNLLAWGALAAEGEMPWTIVPILAVVWLAAAAALLLDVLRARLEGAAAAVVAAGACLALSASLVWSLSGGNAEAPLLAFELIAVAAVLAERRAETPLLRALAALALAGAALTKSEGAIAAALVVAGVLVRDLAWRRPRPLSGAMRLLGPTAVVVAGWAAVRLAHGLPLSDPLRPRALELTFAHFGEVASAFFAGLDAGSWGLSWLLPLVLLLALRRRPLADAAPGLVLTAGLLGFAFVYYLHVGEDPARMVAWTLPRLAQPALGAWILSVGVLTTEGG